MHLREITAAKTIIYSLRYLVSCELRKQHFLDTIVCVSKIQEKFRAYWQIRTAQIALIEKLINRERQRLYTSTQKEAESQLKKVG